YKKLTKFDSALVNALVLKQYVKTKNGRTYQVLKLKSEDDLTFYTTAKKSLEDIKYKKLHLEIFLPKLTFYEYLNTFYANSKIIAIKDEQNIKANLNSYISASHVNPKIANIYQALYSATPLEFELQKAFSTLGVSHLLAISGFHLGVLSALLYFILSPIYGSLQDKFFPYANKKLHLFMLVSSTLFAYMLFLDSPPSVVRAFGMLLVGFILYERGIKIVSMQTLFLTLLLLLAFFPRLFFSLGFWLSALGVFYIFLFLIHFKHFSKTLQFILLPFWVYILMLPFSLAIFENFSLYHPLSIIYSVLFTIFYPLSIFLHVAGFGDLFDTLLESFIALGTNGLHVKLGYELLILHVTLSLMGIFQRKAAILTLLCAVFILIYAIYNVT
ncbi:MAG: competence protein ComEC, partial [Sulfurimonas sp. RIFCSPLOWO2_12_FULL_34_6]